MKFSKGKIEGVVVEEFRIFRDDRGWLSELFRSDSLPEGFMPEMGYISLTYPGVIRGPHEHREQTDYFCFMGHFSLYLWDNRGTSPTYGNSMLIKNAEKMIVIVPPGVVHAYRNTGDSDGLVLNFPDRLYRGPGKKDEVDEVRYEAMPESPFRPDELEEDAG